MAYNPNEPRASNGQWGSGGAGKKDGGASVKAQLVGLAQLARGKGNENKTVVYGKVTPRVAEIAKEKTGVDIADYQHFADMFALRHALKHGDAAQEAKLGQLAVTDKDIAAIPDVVGHPDLVVYAGKTKIGRDAIASIKKLDDGTILVVEEIRTSRQTLALTSMRKYPGTRNAESVAKSVAASSATDSVPFYVQNDTGSTGAIVMDLRPDLRQAPTIDEDELFRRISLRLAQRARAAAKPAARAVSTPATPDNFVTRYLQGSSQS
ncbi:MAG: hypothetical protein LBH10_06425 [Burkholderiaceae bacterium]|jgi:hypothetical protein|nr:hypothetical protein [Burkholderiaceae bacterium]